MSRCATCAHKDVKKIDEDLVKGVAVRRIALETGLTPSSLYRHKQYHLASVTGTEADMDFSEMPKKGDLVGAHALFPETSNIADQLKFLYARSLDIMDKCEKAKDYGTSVKANRQALSCLEMFFRAAEALHKMKNDSKGEGETDRMRGLVLAALAPYAEAKIAVARAMQDKLGGEKK